MRGAVEVGDCCDQVCAIHPHSLSVRRGIVQRLTEVDGIATAVVLILGELTGPRLIRLAGSEQIAGWRRAVLKGAPA